LFITLNVNTVILNKINDKYEIYQPKFETPKLPELDYGVLHSVINSCSQNIASAREGQLIERLKECGFEFKTKQELYNFAKERCEVEIHANKLNRLKVDGKVIAEWWDTVEIKHEGSKVTAIAGNPPSNYL